MIKLTKEVLCMGNVVQMKVNDMEWKHNQSYGGVSLSVAEDMAKKRESQILSPEELSSKIKSKSNQVRCLNPEGKNKVFVYFCKEGEETDTPIHLYNEDGELIMTFPWSGEYSVQDQKQWNGATVKQASLHYPGVYSYRGGGMLPPHIQGFKLTATESGVTYINVIRQRGKEAPTVEYAAYDYKGNSCYKPMPCFDPKKYPDKKVAQEVEDYMKKNKYDGLVFAGAAVGGDKFINYGVKHSFVI